MRPLDARELSVLVDALPLYARFLTNRATKKRGDEARAFSERADNTWKLLAKIQAMHREALTTARPRGGAL